MAKYWDKFKKNSWSSISPDKEQIQMTCEQVKTIENPPKMESGVSENRMQGIIFLFTHRYGCLEMKFWKENKIVTKIMNRLDIPRDSRRLVKNIMKRVLESNERGMHFDPKSELK